jgi:hypothetical protein
MPDIIEGICLEMKSPDARQNLHRHVTLFQEESQGGSLIEEARQSIRHVMKPATSIGSPVMSTDGSPHGRLRFTEIAYYTGVLFA